MSKSYTRDEILAKAREIRKALPVVPSVQDVMSILAAVFPDDPPPVVVREENYCGAEYHIIENNILQSHGYNRWRNVETLAGHCSPNFLRFLADLMDWPFRDPVTGRPCKADRTLKPEDVK